MTRRNGFDPRTPYMPILVLGSDPPLGGLVPGPEVYDFQENAEREGIPVALASGAGWAWFLAQPGRVVQWFGRGPMPPELGGEHTRAVPRHRVPARDRRRPGRRR